MAYKTKDLKVDTLLKDYFTDPCHFADMINATIFDGRQVIRPENVSDFDTSTSTFYEHDGKSITIDRDRDVIKKVTIGDSSILIGIENQSSEDLDMLLRVLEYNLLTQSRQWHQIKTVKDLRIRPPIQSMSLVLNFGEKRWKGPRTYDEALTMVPAEFENIVGHRMFPITDIISIDYHKFRDRDNLDMIKGLQMLYQWKGNLKVFEGIRVRKIVALIIVAHAKNKKLLHIINKKKEENIDMCESMRLYTERILNEGEKRGEKKGEKRGEKRGEKIGVKKGLIETLVDLLRLKLGKLSPKIEIEIEQSTDEQLNQLKMRIFTIENEEDILDALR